MFHYFFPGMKKAGGEFAIEPFDFSRIPAIAASLADVKSPLQATAFERSIDGQAGLFLTPHVGGAAPNVITYQPETQTWIRVPIGGYQEIMIGWDTAKPPTPADLTRAKVYGGYPVPDASGRPWIIPVARAKPSSRSTLPSNFEFDPVSFEAIEKPNPDFDKLWTIAGLIFDHWNSDEYTLMPASLARYALQALMVNYRVGPIELAAFDAMGLSVINETSAATIGMALIDLQTNVTDLAAAIEETAKEKKTEAVDDPSPIDCGSPDETPATAPAALS